MAPTPSWERAQIPTSRNVGETWGAPFLARLWGVERCVLAVGGVAGLSSAEVAGGYALAVALVCQQFDELGFVFDFFVQNARSHIVRARILAEGHVTDLDPTANGAALRFQQQGQNVDRGGGIGKLGGAASRLVMEGGQIVGQFASELVDAGDDQFPMGAILEPCVLTDF